MSRDLRPMIRMISCEQDEFYDSLNAIYCFSITRRSTVCLFSFYFTCDSVVFFRSASPLLSASHLWLCSRNERQEYLFMSRFDVCFFYLLCLSEPLLSWLQQKL